MSTSSSSPPRDKEWNGIWNVLAKNVSMVKVFFAETFQISFRSPASDELSGVSAIRWRAGEWAAEHTLDRHRQGVTEWARLCYLICCLGHSIFLHQRRHRLQIRPVVLQRDVRSLLSDCLGYRYHYLALLPCFSVILSSQHHCNVIDGIQPFPVLDFLFGRVELR